MTTIAHVRQLLGDALKGANDDARNNKVERLILATTGITAALEFLAEIEARPTINTTDPLRDGLHLDNQVKPDEIDEDPPADPEIISAPGGVLFSDGSVIEPDNTEHNEHGPDSVGPDDGPAEG